jgi:hypothetical protein
MATLFPHAGATCRRFQQPQKTGSADSLARRAMGGSTWPSWFVKRPFDKR